MSSINWFRLWKHYPFDKPKSMFKIQSLIMYRFKELRSKPNDVIHQQW